MDRPDAPRLLPLPAEERDDAVAELLAMAGPFGDNHLFTTMVRHPRLYKRWLPYGTAMLYAKLPARDRELLILRSAHRCQSTYEWEQHCAIAPDAGIGAAEIAALQAGPDADGWSPFDAALIRAVDELLDDHLIGDATWETLSSRYDEGLLVEVVMIVGHYFALGLTLNSLGVEPEG